MYQKIIIMIITMIIAVLQTFILSSIHYLPKREKQLFRHNKNNLKRKNKENESSSISKQQVLPRSVCM